MKVTLRKLRMVEAQKESLHVLETMAVGYP